MKYFLLLLTFFVFGDTNAQQGNPNDGHAVVLAQKIAKKMKDTLDLSAQQRQQLYDVNMNLHNQKQDAWLGNPSMDSLTARIQRIEKTRDSLYRPIIGEAKYQAYLQKKQNIVNND